MAYLSSPDDSYLASGNINPIVTVAAEAVDGNWTKAAKRRASKVDKTR